MNDAMSRNLFDLAVKYIPGGVNSPVRAFGSVGRTPLYIAAGKGSKIYDADGNEYIDYVCSWGPLILGHADEGSVDTIIEYAKRGTSFGANTEIEVRFARLLAGIFPSMEMIRMVNSGTEAAMSAVRLARGYTGREKIVKFEGCYHGHADCFLVKAGSGLMSESARSSAGIAEDTVRNTLVARFNDTESVKDLFVKHKSEIAALIVEPVMGNAGVIPPAEGFLMDLRDITSSEGAVLIFDEVITGLRVAPGGAQQLYGVVPDLTCLGKIIGGGLPVGAFGGKKSIMELLAPVGPVYQAGTLSGNPLAMALGMETVLRLIGADGSGKSVYDALEKSGKTLEDGFIDNIRRSKLKASVNRVGSMFSLFFTDEKVRSLDAAKRAAIRLFAPYFASMLENGVYMAPSPFECGFISTKHSEEDLAKTIEANEKSLIEVSKLL